MMREHLQVTTDEVAARVRHRWAKDIESYDRVHEQILKMADMLTAGIIAQFPNEFAAK